MGEREGGRKRGNIRYARRLRGITYLEWLKLAHLINRSFDKQKRELEKGIQLAPDEELQVQIKLL